VDARLDGRTFVRFHVDLGLGDEILEPIDRVVGDDWLGFAGIPAVSVPTLSAEQHWAEKLHAYTRPREGATNTRVRISSIWSCSSSVNPSLPIGFMPQS